MPEALKLWTNNGSAAERAAPPATAAAFWDERNILARHRLRDGDPAGAYALADDDAQTAPEQRADAELPRRLHRPAQAGRPRAGAAAFPGLADVSKAAITQGARALLARPRRGRRTRPRGASTRPPPPIPARSTASSRRWRSATGQAGSRARITALHDPGWNPGEALAFAGRELARASAYLVAGAKRRRAQAFLLRLNEITPDPVDRSMAARLAAGFGMPETAVAIARRAGRDGVILLDAGWPRPADVPPGAGVEPALALGIIRQESSFDTDDGQPGRRARADAADAGHGGADWRQADRPARQAAEPDRRHRA